MFEFVSENGTHIVRRRWNAPVKQTESKIVPNAVRGEGNLHLRAVQIQPVQLRCPSQLLLTLDDSGAAYVEPANQNVYSVWRSRSDRICQRAANPRC